MSDIFLSYASEDRERVRPLAEALAAEGWSVFWDRIIPVGKTWDELLEEELKGARSLVVVWSKNSIKSEWVKEEANEARRLDLPLLPILLDGVLPPLGFRHIQAADFSTWNGSTTSPVFQNLTRDIRQTLGPPATPEPIKPLTHAFEPPQPEPLKPDVAKLSDHIKPSKPARTGLIASILVSGGMVLILLMTGLLYLFMPRPPEPFAQNGRLFVETTPKEATLVLLNTQDNFVQGMELKPGRYHVEVSAEGFETKRQWVELSPGEEKNLPVKLVKTKASKIEKGHLFVNTEPKEATIKILNIRDQFTQGMDLEIGSYHVEVSADGFETKSERVELGAGEDKHIRIKLTEIKPSPYSEVTIAKTFTNNHGMNFVLIPAGTFPMGSPLSEQDRFDDEKQHQVSISKPFYLQTKEVTQGQWQKVMGNNPSQFKECGDDCPVEKVSWYEAQEFITRLNQMEETDKYRLPTEAEWEYACRAKSKSNWFFGEDEAKLSEYAWYNENSEEKTHPVGQKKPNAWGLYDMLGNVYEWCWDWYGEYPLGAVKDPTGPASGEKRVLRGGSWRVDERFTRSAFRNYGYPDNRGSDSGFRVVRDL